jgi:hypothetical protein
MLPISENVFSTLFKARSGSEDFLTEAFVFLLRLLLKRVPDMGVTLINQFSGLPRKAHFEHPESVVVSTQVIVDEGRPDIEIRDGQGRLVYVEVKHDGPLGIGQLEYYLAKLKVAPEPITGLVLLTRSRVSAHKTTLARDQYHHVCWYEVYNWLAETDIQDEVGQYFACSFMSFLEEKQMSMEKVPPEYLSGVSALLKLTRMMETSITEAMPDAKYRVTAGWSWRGFFVDGVYFYGVRLDQPSLVVFENNLGTSPTHKRDLALNSMDFFSMSKDEQFESLVDFLRQAGQLM